MSFHQINEVYYDHVLLVLNVMSPIHKQSRYNKKLLPLETIRLMNPTLFEDLCRSASELTAFIVHKHIDEDRLSIIQPDWMKQRTSTQ